METLIISAFPACGKTYFAETNKDKIILDSDSSKFSWIVNPDGSKERNPDFPDNYIKHIKENIGKADYILVSSHKDVRDALIKENIDFYLIYPNRHLLNEWIGRCYRRPNNGVPIDVLIDNWDNWIADCESNAKNGVKYVELASGEYLYGAIINIHHMIFMTSHFKEICKDITRIISQDIPIEANELENFSKITTMLLKHNMLIESDEFDRLSRQLTEYWHYKLVSEKDSKRGCSYVQMYQMVTMIQQNNHSINTANTAKDIISKNPEVVKIVSAIGANPGISFKELRDILNIEDFNHLYEQISKLKDLKVIVSRRSGDYEYYILTYLGISMSKTVKSM